MTQTLVTRGTRGRTAGPAPRQKLVRDLMITNVITLKPTNSLADLYDRMDDEHIRHMPIVDRDGDLVGLVTESDLIRLALGSQTDLPLSLQQDLLRGRKIREIMATEVDTIEPDQPLKDAALELLENKAGCLPVVEGSHVVGILTEADFVRHFAENS